MNGFIVFGLYELPLYFNEDSSLYNSLFFLRLKFFINIYSTLKAPLCPGRWGKQLVLGECFPASKYLLLEIPPSEMHSLVLSISST